VEAFFFLEQREILLITHGNVDEAVEVFFIDFIYEHKLFEYTRSLWKLFFLEQKYKVFSSPHFVHADEAAEIYQPHTDTQHRWCPRAAHDTSLHNHS